MVAMSFKAVFPLLAFMLLGLFLSRKGFMKADVSQEINRLVFRVFLPLNIFENIYSAKITERFDSTVALYVGISCVASFVVVGLIVRSTEKDCSVSPVMIQGICKSNYILIVSTIVSSFYGNELGMTPVLVMIVTPVFNTCTTVVFETARGGRINPLNLLKKIILNPMVLSSLLGILANFSGIQLPAFIVSGVVKKLGAMATPLALLSLGAGFKLSGMKKYAGKLAVICAGKLVILPLVIVPAAALVFGIRGADLIAIFVYCGAPTAVNSYSTAVSMGGNEELAGQIVVLTSSLSIITMFCWLCVMGALGWL